jgi:hypothetical protein
MPAPPTVICPAPACMTSMRAPNGKKTAESFGTVTVIAAALAHSTRAVADELEGALAEVLGGGFGQPGSEAVADDPRRIEAPNAIDGFSEDDFVRSQSASFSAAVQAARVPGTPPSSATASGCRSTTPCSSVLPAARSAGQRGHLISANNITDLLTHDQAGAAGYC